MKGHRRAGFSSFTLVLFLASIWATGVASGAVSVLVWQGDVYHDGVPVTTSIILQTGVKYRIVVAEMWWYNQPANLAADAQYYTTDGSDSWNWGNHFHAQNAPGAPVGASFLQINGKNINWGPFSNGDTGHTYSVYFFGEGTAITFKIEDWMDHNYDNNESHLPVKIYMEPSVGGVLVPTNTLVILAPYLASIGLVATAALAAKKRRH